MSWVVMYQKCVFVALFCTCLISCTDINHEKTSAEKFDNGLNAFNQQCISCHHVYKNRINSIYPSAQDIRSQDSLSRIRMLNEMKKDDVHKKLIQSISKSDLDDLCFYLSR